ncbi:MAG: hypothetical protein R6X25_13810 [Candidatus Krumholzibacteriia bacterium]
MAFDPMQEKGMPLEKQLLTYEEIASRPYDKKEVHPYTRCRAILMNGIEVEAALFGHQFARNAPDLELRRQLAAVRRIEQQQQKAVNWLIPGDESGLEVTIGFEQVAVDLTAYLARTETNPKVKAALDFALLEDFDHLYRYANLMNMTEGKRAAEITGEYTEIMPGRPTALEHRHPFDEVREFADRTKGDPLTNLHILTIVAAEQQTMNLYMNIGNRPTDQLGRELYAEIAQIEEQHVTHYESLLDARAGWFEMLLLHEYNECWLYWSLVQDEPDERIRRIWERNLEMEIHHLHLAAKLFQKQEKRDPAEVLPAQMPEPFRFQSNVGYVREILAEQAHWNAHGTEYYPRDAMPDDDRYRMYQEAVGAVHAPSVRVIDEHERKQGAEYRQELEGEHPIAEMRPGKKGKAGA